MRPSIARLLAATTLLTTASLALDPPAVQWQKSYTGAGDADGFWVEQTDDSGYIAAGWTKTDTLLRDCYLLKTDRLGDIEWERSFGVVHGEDGLNCVRQTVDGGYIAAGFAGPDYGRQPYVVKTDSLGFIQWEKVLACYAFAEAFAAEQTPDGGYVVSALWTGFADSAGIHVFKLDSAGSTLWHTVLRNGGQVCGTAVVRRTSDGGYIVGGALGGALDTLGLWLVRLNSSGDSVWARTYPTQKLGDARSVVQTTDNGFAVVGYGDMDGDPDDPCAMYLAKTDSNGILQWKKTYGGPDMDGGYCVQQTSDGGYVLAGGWVRPDSNYDAAIVKANATGVVTWTRTFGSIHGDAATCVRQTFDGGYIVVGGGVADPDAGSGHLFLIKLTAGSRAR